MWLALMIFAGPWDHAGAKKLNLANQKIESVPADVGKMKKLVELDLGYNPISELPAEIGELAALESLSLRCTKLTKLPESVAKLTKLKRLDLSSAMDCEDVFRMTPAVAALLGKLPQLTELRIAFMHMKTIPAEALASPKLKVLDVSYNELSAYPKAWPEALEDLDLSGNELTTTPDLSALKKLKKVAIGGQRGKKTIPPEQLEALRKALPKVKVIAE